MANLQRLLGGMLASGLAGRSRRGPAFAAGLGGLGGLAMGGSSGGFGRLRNAAGLAGLGYLAYQAYQNYQGGSGGTATPPPGGQTHAGQPAGGQRSGGSLGEKLGSLLGMGKSEPEPVPAPPPEAQLGDDKALLLIRAMIAAANADGEIDAEERRRIVGALDQAGAGPDERRVLEHELANPRPVDELIAAVPDRETGEQVYLASKVAMDPDTRAEIAYLDYLASRLNLEPGEVEELNKIA